MKSFNVKNYEKSVKQFVCLGLNENNEDLQAQMLTNGLDAGMRIISETRNSSLAAEFEAMSENEVILFTKNNGLYLCISVKCEQKNFNFSSDLGTEKMFLKVPKSKN